MTDPTISQEAREAAWQDAVAETNRLQRELDITNADHIALWIEHNTIPDEPMNQCVSWLACRIVEAFEAHLRSTSPVGEVGEMIERLRQAVKPLDDLPPSIQTMKNIRIVDAAHEAAAMPERVAASDTEAMRLLQNLSAWLAWVDHDLDEVCADGGITAAMVVQQEARGYRARIDAALAKGGAA